MRVTSEVMKSIDLSSAAKFCLGTPLDRLPMLVSDSCLSESQSAVIKWVEANFSGGLSIPKEVITMPKSKFGQRPVIISSLPSRILYQGLVEKIRKDVGSESRGGDAWDNHESFAEESTTEYIVAVDIAACYEFIDHERLRQEIVARTLDADVAKVIIDFLGECSPNSRGLPQLTSASDTLADLYLDVIQRRLMRQRLDVSRYADDFFIRVGSWEAANETIEYAAEFARDMGLILSYEKTRAVRSSTFKKKVESQRELQKRYFDSEKERMTLFHVAGGDRYDDVTLVEILPDDAEALKSSMRKVIGDWQDRTAEAARNPDLELLHEASLRRLLPLAISVLQDDAERIRNKVFVDLVDREPIRLERVCKYILGRVARPGEENQNWALLKSLTKSGRLSPWARIWILHVVGMLPEIGTSDFQDVQRWVKRQMLDRHETVRVQAAWAAAKFRNLDEGQVTELLREATPVTQAGIAASMGRKMAALASTQRGGGFGNSLINSVTGESVLFKRAFEWGGEN